MVPDTNNSNPRRQNMFDQRLKQRNSSQSPRMMRTAPSDETDESLTTHSQVQIEKHGFCKGTSESGNLTKLRIESPNASRSAKKKEWMKKRAKYARATISPISTKNTAIEAKVHCLTDKKGDSAVISCQEITVNTVDTSEDDPTMKSFTFSPTAANDISFNSQKQHGLDIINPMESIALHPSDETSIQLVATIESQDTLEDSVQTLHSLTSTTSGTFCSLASATSGDGCTLRIDQPHNHNSIESPQSFTTDTDTDTDTDTASLSEQTINHTNIEALPSLTTDTTPPSEQTQNQYDIEALPSFTSDTTPPSEHTKDLKMIEAVPTSTTDTTSMSDEDRNDDNNIDGRYQDAEYYRDDFDALFVTHHGHNTIPSSSNSNAPSASPCAMKDQTACAIQPAFANGESLHPRTTKVESTCLGEARLHSMLEKVSKESFERTTQSKWWDEESKTASCLSLKKKACGEPNEDIFETMSNSISQLFESMGCNFSMCTEIDDRIGNEINIDHGLQSIVEDDITLDLSSFVPYA
eukprot:scaffold10188_cov280-Chaetoceros_neogracile.AAC.10